MADGTRGASAPFALVGALLGFLGVAAGAFGAHALRAHVAPELLAAFETGVRYQLVHALALLFVGWAARGRPRGPLHAAGVLFLVGTVLFSGSLYGLALSGAHWLGAVTPFGGLSLLAGWLALAVGLARERES